MSEPRLRAKLCLGVCNDSNLRDLRMQRSDLEIVCALHHWRIVGAYEISEHIAAQQPSQQLQAMLKAARKGEFDILVTWGLDQICWMEKSSFSRILLTLQESNVQFYS